MGCCDRDFLIGPGSLDDIQGDGGDGERAGHRESDVRAVFVEPGIVGQIVVLTLARLLRSFGCGESGARAEVRGPHGRKHGRHQRDGPPLDAGFLNRRLRSLRLLLRHGRHDQTHAQCNIKELHEPSNAHWAYVVP